jgi:hypothetical protein
MGTVVGRYVATFNEADLGMLEGASLNAPYAFHWVKVHRVEGKTLVCSAAGDVMHLAIRRKHGRECAGIIFSDPVFGPTSFKLAPFKQDSTPPLALL